MFKHGTSAKNIVVDALSRRSYILTNLYIIITSFKTHPNQYNDDVDFGVIWKSYKDYKFTEDYSLYSGYLIKGLQLYILRTFLRDHLL